MKGTSFAQMLGWGAGLVIAGLASAQEARLTPPVNWVEMAPPGFVECRAGLQPQLSNADYRRFAARNQIWPQPNLVEKEWEAGKVLNKPSLKYPKGVTGLPSVIAAELHVLVGEKGSVLDSVVRCTNAPSLNEAIIELAPNFKFRPTRYQGKELITVFPVRITLRR
jgi:hypothetical protein